MNCSQLVILLLFCLESIICPRPLPYRCLKPKAQKSKVCPLVRVERRVYYYEKSLHACQSMDIGSCYIDGENLFKSYEDCDRTCLEDTSACCMCCCDDEPIFLT